MLALFSGKPRELRAYMQGRLTGKVEDLTIYREKKRAHKGQLKKQFLNKNIPQR